MSRVYYYELVDSSARKCVDLTEFSRVIENCIYRSIPDLDFVEVFEGFYCFKVSDGADEVSVHQLRKLGRWLAGRLPKLCGHAMRHYYSECHQPSNQLFKRVTSEKRRAVYERQLLDW